MRRFVKNILSPIILLSIANAMAVGQSNRLLTAGKMTYYVDSNHGSDLTSGLSEKHPWRTLKKIEKTKLLPGDTVKFKRGSHFYISLIIKDSGTKDARIVFTDYGDTSYPAPAFTNPKFNNNEFGNCIRIKGNYITIENLYFYNTASVPANFHPYQPFLTVWQMGAIHIDRGASHCVIKNNEIKNCVAGIRSNGEHTLITQNYIHDCNRILKEWSWGPIGIWLGADFQKVTHNKVFNYRVVNPKIRWAGGIGGGADGGAFEIDDARYNKSHIIIAYNYTRDCQGFLEVTEHDVRSPALYKNFKIHHNISDDYQQFLALWAGSNCDIDNNTIVRRKKDVSDWGVFNIAQDSSKNKIRNNIIITEKNIKIFNTGLGSRHYPEDIVKNNLYYAASGRLEMGYEGPGLQPVFANPLLANYRDRMRPDDYSITANSPAIHSGLALGYNKDFRGNNIQNGRCDIGAFEYVNRTRVTY